MGRVTLFGFLRYMPDLFANIELPESCEKDLLIDTIIMESGDLFPYYQQPVYLKRNIEVWFSRMRHNFERMFLAIESEYNPIHNFDRYEEYTDAREGSENENRNANNNMNSTNSANGETVTTNNVSDGGSDTTENRTSAFNSSDYEPDNVSTITRNTNINANDTTRNSDKSTTTVNASNIENNEIEKRESLLHSGHLYGNIGVTQSAQMVNAELDLRKYDIYLEIAKQFEKRFLVQIY